MQYNDTYPLMRDKKPRGCGPIVLAILVAIALIVFSATIGGCYTQKKATEQTNKALIKYPAVVAKIARDAFPCVTLKADTLVSVKDSLIYIDCPDTGGNGSAEDFAGKDTVIITKVNTLPGKVIRVPVTLPVSTVTIVQKVEDSAKIFLLTKQLEAEKQLAIDNANAARKWQGRAERRIKLVWWLLIALLISGYFNFRNVKRKIFGK
jgi:hypothetical protein